MTYREVWPHADLRYTVTAVGMKEDIILASAEAPTEYVFLVETRGVRVQKDLDGSIGFYDLGTGGRIWMIPTCYALDTRSAGETPVTIPAAMPLRMELRKGDSGVQLHIFLDPLWLQDTARVFPVTVDPTIFQDNPALETNEWNTSAEARFMPNYDQEVTCRWDLGMPWGMWGIRPSECAVYDTRNNNRVMYRKRVDYWDSGVDYFRAQGNVSYRAWAQCGITGTIWGQYYGHAKLYITYRKNSTPVVSPTVPSNGYFSRQSTVQFGWAYTDGDGDPQRGFTWQLARDSGFGQIEHTEESRTASATFGYKLPAEGTWFWRVRASDGIFWSDWTPGRRLIADWSPPQATGSPVAQPDPEDPGKKLAVSWKAWQDGASGVKEYILQWALPGQDFTDQRQEALAGTSYSVGGWGYDQKVRFRMKASDYAGNVSEWTSEFTGATAAENSTILSASPGWDTADGHFVDIHLKKVTASGYRVKRVEVAGDSPGEPAPVVESDWFTETIYRDKAWGPEKPGLKPHGRYNYYVQTKNQEGRPTDWIAYADKDGKVVAVQVKNMPPAPPTLVFPANESTVNTKRLQCIIPGDPDGDAVQVRFEVTNVKDSNGLPDFTPTQLVFDSGWTSQADIAADALTGLKDGTYYWRVRARDDLKGDLANQSLEADLGGAYSTFTLDTTGMAGSFEITPAGATARRQVTLTNVVASSSAGDEPVAVRFRNELEGLGPDEGWQGWAWPVAPSGITWDLPAGDGPKTVAMELKDRAGNWGPPFRQSVILDTVAPESPAMARVVGGPSRAMVEWLAPRDPGEAEHTASGVAGYSVRYRRAGETEWRPLASKQVDGAARRATLTGLKDNERVDFEVQAQDRAGNLSAWSGTATGYSLPAAGVIAEYRSGYGETAGHYVEFFVAPVAADRCRIEVTHDAGGGSGSDWFPAPAAGYDPGAEGSQPQFRDEGLVSHGEYRYRLVTANPAGEETYGPERTITVANLPPEAPTLLYPKGWVSSVTAELSILGPSVDRDGDPLTYTYSVWDAQGNPILADATSPTVSGLQDGGAYTWQVKVSDGYGGAAGSDMATFQVDLAPPQITLGNVSNEWAAEQQIVVSATDGRSGLTSLEYAWGDGPLTEMAPGQAILAPHGIQTLHVRATDAAGNVSEISHVYFVDSTPPEVSIPEVEGKPLIIQPDGPQYRLGVTSGDGLFARWRVADPESGVGAYRVGLVDDAVVQEAWKQEGGDGSLPIDPATLETVTEIHSDGVHQRAVPGQLQDGHAYRVVVQAQSRVGRWSTYVLSEPVFADSSPPELVPPTVTGATDWGGNLYTADFANLQVQMEARDPHSGVASLSYALIRQPSLKGDETWANNVGDLNSQAASLPDGASCYIAVRAVNYAGLQAVAFTPAIIVDRTPPSIEKLVARGVAHPSKGFVTATLEAHDAQSGLRTCRFALGTTAGGHDLTDGAPGAQGGWLQRMYPSSPADLQIAGLPLPAGDVYLTVAVTNGAGREATSTVKVNLAAAEPAPVVVDDGAFTPSTREFHAWWTFVPAQAHTVQSYRYRLLDSAGHLVFDWKSLDAQAAGNPVEILERGTDPAQGLGLAQGRTYILQVQVIYSDGSPSPVGESDGIIVDATPPEGLAVEDGVYAPAGRLALRWQATDDASGIASYSFAVGTRPGLTDVTGGWRNVGPATEVVCTSLPLREGAVYYSSVMATNGAGLESIAQSDGVRIDSTPPPAPKVQDGGLFTPDPTRLTASWLWTQDDPESGTVTFDYAILSSREIPLDVTWIPAGSARRLEARGLSLEDGATYYVAVRATNGAGLTSVGVSDGIGVDTTAPEVPRIDDGNDYQTDASSLSATFSAIDPQSGVRGYLYSAGTQAEPGSVARDVPFDPQGGASTARLAGLSLQSGQIYFFTVQAINQAGLVSNGGTSDGVMIDTGFPEVTDVQDEGSYTQNPAQLIASWSARPAASPIVEYQYAVVEDPFTGSPPWRSNGRLTYVLAKDLNLQDGKTYYVLVRAKSAAGSWTPQDHLGKSDGILVDSTPPPPPQVRVEARYTAGNLHFAWSGEDPESEIACWRYAVGSSRGGTDLTGGWVEVPGNVQEQTLTGLPVADGVAYYVTVLGQNKAGAWSEKGFSAAVFGDLTPPERPKITLRGSYTRSRQQIPSVQWQSADPQVGLASWRFAVVLAPASPGSPGAGEPPSAPAPSAVPPESAFSPPIPIRANSWQGDLTGLDLTEGAAYFVAIQTQNALGL
ncbi:MAG: fibronectin type III domain-containing protein [Firmicutes bacterium]|nr:fibronectin type III domain-containing protein [Bacillota bacterium]